MVGVLAGRLVPETAAPGPALCAQEHRPHRATWRDLVLPRDAFPFYPNPRRKATGQTGGGRLTGPLQHTGWEQGRHRLAPIGVACRVTEPCSHRPRSATRAAAGGVFSSGRGHSCDRNCNDCELRPFLEVPEGRRTAPCGVSGQAGSLEDTVSSECRPRLPWEGVSEGNTPWPKPSPFLQAMVPDFCKGPWSYLKVHVR